jgi:POT family proton-dependent oligopeptide transporter
MLHTLGELTLSPVGLSLVTKLSPAQIVGFLMGIWFLSSSIAHQAGKHIAKLTTVSEANIMLTDGFTSSLDDETLKNTLASDMFVEMLKEMPTEKALVSSKSIEMLNSNLSEPMFVKDSVQVDVNNKLETIYFLSYAEDSTQRAVQTKEEANSIYEASISGSVISSLRNESLGLGLSVFRILGFFAIGCGALLFLLGPIISRWMHGIK